MGDDHPARERCGAVRISSAIQSPRSQQPWQFVGSALASSDILELAAAQAGLAFENELLRRQTTQPH